MFQMAKHLDNFYRALHLLLVRRTIRSLDCRSLDFGAVAQVQAVVLDVAARSAALDHDAPH